MRAIDTLDPNALNAVKIALDGVQRYKGHDSVKYFAKIVEALAGNVDGLDIWAIRDLIRQEDERRSRRQNLGVVDPSDYERIKTLGAQELRVLQLVGQGQRNQAIADLLNISYRTAANHKAHLVAKLGLSSGRELVKFAIQNIDIF